MTVLDHYKDLTVRTICFHEHWTDDPGLHRPRRPREGLHEPREGLPRPRHPVAALLRLRDGQHRARVGRLLRRVPRLPAPGRLHAPAHRRSTTSCCYRAPGRTSLAGTSPRRWTSTTLTASTSTAPPTRGPAPTGPRLRLRAAATARSRPTYTFFAYARDDEAHLHDREVAQARTARSMCTTPPA